MIDVFAAGAGQGSTDDAPLLQGIIDAAPAHSTLYFPSARYNVLSTLRAEWPDGTAKALTFRGERQGYPGNAYLGGAHIIGNVAGPLLRGLYPASSLAVIDMAFANLNVVEGVGLEIGGSSPCIDRIAIHATHALILPENTFLASVRSITLRCSGWPAGSRGLMVNGHAAIRDFDIVGFEEAVRANGIGVDFRCGRVEVNKTAFVLGRKANGDTWALNASSIDDVSLEANDVAFDVYALGRSSIRHIVVQGSVNSPSAGSKRGIRLRGNGTQDCEFADIVLSGGYSEATIQADAGNGVTWQGVRADNTLARPAWDVRGNLLGMAFHGCNYRLRPTEPAAEHLQRGLRIHALGGIDYTKDQVEGRNLRGKLVPVAEGATSKAIVFPTGKTAGAGAIYQATAAVGTGTLVPGTYYLIGSLLTSHGETGAFGEKAVTLVAPENQIAVSFYGAYADAKRRLYVGRAPGVYDGYLEMPFGSGPFVYGGQALDGIKGPVGSGLAADPDTDCREPDGDYAVVPSASWPTRVGVSARGTDGFTLTFDTPAPAGGTVDWVMVR